MTGAVNWRPSRPSGGPKGKGPASFFADYAFFEGIAVAPKTGSSFLNELADRRTRADLEDHGLGAEGREDLAHAAACEDDAPALEAADDEVNARDGFGAGVLHHAAKNRDFDVHRADDAGDLHVSVSS